MIDNKNVLIVEDDSIDALFFKHALGRAGYDVTVAEGALKALDILAVDDYSLLLIDLKLAEMDGIELLDIAKRYYPQVEVIIITAHASVETAVKAMRRGARSYFIKGDPVDKLIAEVEKCTGPYAKEFSSVSGKDSYRLHSRGAHFSRVLNFGENIGQIGGNLLVVGVEGVGRRALAEFIHSRSNNANDPFMEVDCSLFTQDTSDDEIAELVSEAAMVHRSSGTIYLKDVGLGTPENLSGFMKVLQDCVDMNTFTAPGMVISSASVKDVLVLKSRFGPEIFFNYWLLRVELPGLVDRRGDLPLLVPRIVKLANSELGTNIDGVEKDLMNDLAQSVFVNDFSGLEKFIFRLASYAGEGTLNRKHLEYIETSDILLDRGLPVASGEPRSLKEVRMRAEVEHIQLILDRTGGRKSLAAAALGVSSRQLYNMLKKYGLG